MSSKPHYRWYSFGNFIPGRWVLTKVAEPYHPWNLFPLMIFPEKTT